MAYRVVDIEATSDALRAQGKRLLYPEPRRGTAGSRINFLHPKDAGGVLVELVEPAAQPPIDRFTNRSSAVTPVTGQPVRSGSPVYHTVQ